MYQQTKKSTYCSILIINSYCKCWCEAYSCTLLFTILLFYHFVEIGNNERPELINVEQTNRRLNWNFSNFFPQVFIRLFFVQTDNFIAFWFDSCNVQSQKNQNIQICLELLSSHLKELLNSTTEIMLFPKMLVLLFFPLWNSIISVT